MSYMKNRLPDETHAQSWSAIERTRQAIEQRKKVLEREIAERKAEIDNLDWEWDQTCKDADQLMNARAYA